MGFACPVCDEHVPDADHLADHLAFAAVTGASDHEEWLDERAPGWEDGGTDDLAPRVTEYAEEVEFEVDTEPVHDHPHGHESGLPGDTSGAQPMDAETQQIVQEAAELTRQMYSEEAEDGTADESVSEDGHGDSGEASETEGE